MSQDTSLSRRSSTASSSISNSAVKDRLLNEPRVSVFDRSRLLVSLIFLCALCGNSPAQDFKNIHPGVEYAQVVHMLGSDPVKINLLRLDLTKARLDVHHALDAAIGTEKTSSIATRHAAIAAINAGFFRLDNSIFAGDSAGILKIDGNVWSEAINERVAFFIFNELHETQVAIGKMKSLLRVVGKNGWIDVTGVNRERKENDLVVYTPEFHRSTLTSDGGIEVIVRDGKIVQSIDGKGNNRIPDDGFVISASGDGRASIQKLKQLKKIYFGAGAEIARTHVAGDLIALRGRYQPVDEDIVGGVPQLIKDGKIDITWEQEKAGRTFVELRHPRTAVAKLNDGKFLMITVDGRQPGVSVGMNLQELAAYLLSLGATDAMNLDGGGSTAMFIDGKIVNTPSDKEGERKVSDAIVVTLRKADSARRPK